MDKEIEVNEVLRVLFEKYKFEPVEILRLPGGMTILLDKEGKDCQGKQWRKGNT